jgi:hypothetical protein
MNPEQQRGMAQVHYYKELIQKQMFDYQKVRLEEERYEQELDDLKE